jgi:hypothetical protein
MADPAPEVVAGEQPSNSKTSEPESPEAQTPSDPQPGKQSLISESQPTDKTDLSDGLNEKLSGRFKSADDVVDAYLSLEQKLGTAATEKPPEKAGDYEFKVSDLPDGVQVNKQFLEKFKEKAHGLDLSNEKAGSLLSWYFDEVGNSTSSLSRALTEAKAEGEKTMKTEWGDKYVENVKTSGRGMKHYAGSDFEAVKDIMDETGMGSHPAVLRMFMRIGETIKESQIVTGETRPEAKPQKTLDYGKSERQFAERQRA